MKKILFFIVASLFCITGAESAVRTANSPSRNKTNTVSITPTKTRTKTSRTAVNTTVSARASKPVTVLVPKTKSTATRTSVSAQSRQNTRVISRAAATTQATQKTETKTGAAYEQCKQAYFTCMDQFCQMKNDTFRRCSCNDRVFDFQNISDTYQQVGQRLTEFSENLETVGMTREQALAMKTASEGEDALTEDKSASKQLLSAIMNAIKGEKTSVGGKYKDLNSVSMTTDMTNAFGMEDSGQIIASYNGSTLYKAVYPNCRTAVSEDCNSASLQRAVNAYLMAIEQDCNTVESALVKQQKTLKASTKQSSAMLDLARVENHQKHNTDDVATCLVNVEQAIQSEQVCGAKYHKCLDYGQYIDVATGQPLIGVANFYKLAEILTFKNTENIKDQNLSKLSSNRTFVQFFENKTKKFAQDALNNCSDKADEVWSQYLDRALLDIYYSQKAKVEEIQNSCINLVSACYENQQSAIASAMSALTNESSLNLKPGVIDLTKKMCADYIDSCDNMFADSESSSGVVKKYLENKDFTDSVSACRSVVQQCFDKFGGTGYENFYYPYSGLFSIGNAIDWFTLYNIQDDTSSTEYELVSPCAKELAKTEGCSDKKILERVFGGFDKYTVDSVVQYKYTQSASDRQGRTRGVATEIYYKILDNLSTQCSALNGYFVEPQYVEQYGYVKNSPCNMDTKTENKIFYINRVSAPNSLAQLYKLRYLENICPANYTDKVDVQSWGACSCWENGGLRSKNGQSQICMPVLPIKYIGEDSTSDPACLDNLLSDSNAPERSTSEIISWCQNTVMSSTGRLCPTTYTVSENEGAVLKCARLVTDSNTGEKTSQEIPTVETSVPNHKYTSD